MQVNRLLDEVTEAKEKKAEHQHSFAPKLAQLGTGDDVPMQASGRSQSGPQRSSRAADIAAALVKETLRSSADPGSIIASQRRSTLGTTREAPGYGEVTTGPLTSLTDFLSPGQDTPAVKRAPQ